MKIDISCLELLLMSLESGVSVPPSAALLSDAARHLAEGAVSLNPGFIVVSEIHTVTQSSFIFFFYKNTNFYHVRVHFILKV